MLSEFESYTLGEGTASAGRIRGRMRRTGVPPICGGEGGGRWWWWGVHTLAESEGKSEYLHANDTMDPDVEGEVELDDVSGVREV